VVFGFSSLPDVSDQSVLGINPMLLWQVFNFIEDLGELSFIVRVFQPLDQQLDRSSSLSSNFMEENLPKKWLAFFNHFGFHLGEVFISFLIHW
jgi:hypothetical protein